MSELELAVAVEAAMKLSGTHRLTFPTNLGSGERTHLVSPSPTAKRIERGELVLLDCGATFGGYCGDMARTAVIGEPTAEQRRQLDCVVEMFEASRALLRPGAAFGAIHDAAARAAEARGFRHAFGSGHSIGVQNHEFPDIAAGATAVLEPNMVVALEPLLIVPGVGGARLEDTFLITEDGAEPLMAEPLRQWA
jgi:Xaa-Pro dipeptidase